jgi:hypothetical protein
MHVEIVPRAAQQFVAAVKKLAAIQQRPRRRSRRVKDLRTTEGYSSGVTRRMFNTTRQSVEDLTAAEEITQIRKSPKYADFRPGNRTQEEFFHFRKVRFGTFVEIPRVRTLMGDVPKDAAIRQESFQFLLTPQRWELLDEFLNHLYDHTPHQMILSGPIEASKSSVIAVFRVFAFFSDTMSLYIPDGANVAINPDDMLH